MLKRTHSWKTMREPARGKDGLEIIVAHPLKRLPDAEKNVEGLVQTSLRGRVKLPAGLHTFAFDADDVIRRGEKGLNIAYQAFLTDVEDTMDKSGNNRKILFICYDIAAWFVIRLLAEYLPNHEGKAVRIAGAILLGIDGIHLPSNAGVNYLQLLKRWNELWLKRTPTFLGMKGKSRGKPVTKDAPRIEQLGERLRWFDGRFIELASKSSSLGRIREHVLALPLPVDAIDMYPAVTESPKNELADAAERLWLAIQYVDTNSKMTELQHIDSYKYFQKAVRSKPNQSKLRDPSPPQRCSTEQAPRERARSQSFLSAKYPFTLSRVLTWSSSSEVDEWLDNFYRAQTCFLRCELNDADVLYDRCGKIIKQGIFANTDIPLRNSLQRAVIAIMKGHYRTARQRLERIERDCKEEIRKLQLHLRNEPARRSEPAEKAVISPSASRSHHSGDVVEDTKRKEDLLHNFTLLQHEAIYQSAVTRTREGELSKASDGLCYLYKEYERLRICLISGIRRDLPLDFRVESPEAKLVVAISRLRGLVNGYRGHYVEAARFLDEADELCDKMYAFVDNSSSRSDDIDTAAGFPSLEVDHHDRRSPAVREMQAAVQLSKAKVLMMRGLFEEGLNTINRALETIEEILGVLHLLSLETRCIKAMLLVFSCDLKQAQLFSQETMLLMTKHISSDHPLFLEMTFTSVLICKLRARPLEALTTSQSLSALAIRTLGEKNPQTLRYGFLEASLHRWVGNYKTAGILLQDLLKRAEEKWSRGDQQYQHPWIMQCLAELAFTHAIAGDLGEADKAMMRALEDQVRLYLQPAHASDKRSKHTSTRDRVRLLVLSILPKIENWNLPVRESSKSTLGGLSQIIRTCGPHQDLVMTLELWAKIEIARPDGDRKLVTRVQTMSHAYRRDSPFGGDHHIGTLTAALDLANTLREEAIDEQLEQAGTHYSRIIRDESEWLDNEHPLKLAARQGHALLNVHKGSPGFRTAMEITTLFCAIPMQQTLRLGRHHPETIRSMLTTFAVVSYIEKEKAIEISNDITNRLQHRSVREQRPVERALQLERLALLHFARGDLAYSLRLLSQLVSELDINEDRPPDASSDRPDLHRRIQEEEKMIRDVATESFNRCLAEARAARTHSENVVAETIFCKAADLAATLYDDGSSTAKSIHYEWALSLWDSAEEQSNKNKERIEDILAANPTSPASLDVTGRQQKAVDIIGSLSRVEPLDSKFGKQLKWTLDTWARKPQAPGSSARMEHPASQ